MKGGLNGNSDARCRCSHRSISVKGVGCEVQEKTWTMVCGFTPQVVPLHMGAGDQYRNVTIEMEGATEGLMEMD